MEVVKSKKGISVFRCKYVHYLLIKTGMLGCKPSDTPIKIGKKIKDLRAQ